MSDIKEMTKLQKVVARLFNIPVNWSQEEFEEQYQHDTSNVPSRIDSVQDGERPEVTLPVPDEPKETEEEKKKREVDEKYERMRRNLLLNGERTIRANIIQAHRMRTGRETK